MNLSSFSAELRNLLSHFGKHPLFHSESQREVKEVRPKPRDVQKAKEASSTVRSELNLEKSSVFTVSTYKGESRELVFRKKIGREVVEKRITIGKTPGGKETGVLTTNHFKVYLALIELWEKAGKPTSGPVHFTTYKIVKRLDLVDNGQSYQRVRRWIRDLRYIPISFIHSFYNPEMGRYTDLADVTILNHLRIYERKKTNEAESPRGYGKFQFDRYILQNLISNYVHPLRLDVIKSFKKRRDLAILLYTYIDRNLAFKNRFEITLKTLFDNLDLSQNYVNYPSDRKRAMEPVTVELLGKPLSTGILTSCQIQETKSGKDYKLVCRKRVANSFRKAQESPAEPQKTMASQRKEIAQKARTAAEKWAQRPPEDRIAEVLKAWVWGQKHFDNHEPTEEEIKARKKELIAGLPSKEEYEQQLIREMERN